MNVDEQADPTVTTALAVLRGAMDTQNAPPGVEKELMAAFAKQFPRKRWYHALSPRQWSLGAGSTVLATAMALVLTMQTPAPLDPGAGIAYNSVDDGGPFIALESAERIEQEADPRVIEADLPRGEEQPVHQSALAVGADRARGARRGDEFDRHQNSPSMVPSGWTRIPSAAGVLLRPGIVMISPASATTNPAPADG